VTQTVARSSARDVTGSDRDQVYDVAIIVDDGNEKNSAFTEMAIDNED
jgi:hypothetical protein